MKFLVFTDTHNSKSSHKKIKDKVRKEKPNFLLCCGDFSIFMHGAKEFLDFLESLKVRTYFIHGNHEDEDEIELMCKNYKYLVFVHEKVLVYKDVLIMGYGGGGFALTDPRFTDIEKLFEASIKKHPECKKIIILHQPPHKSGIDEIYGDHAGCKTTKKFIEKHNIDYVYAGHLHENFGMKKKIKSTLYMNPGPDGEIIEL